MEYIFFYAARSLNRKELDSGWSQASDYLRPQLVDSQRPEQELLC